MLNTKLFKRLLLKLEHLTQLNRVVAPKFLLQLLNLPWSLYRLPLSNNPLRPLSR